MSAKLSLGIIGHGFVGKAVSYGFQTPNVKQHHIDPKLGSNIQNDLPKDVDVVFICVPTPMNDDLSINSSIVEKVVAELLEHTTHCPIVIKSTVTPDKLSTKESTYNIQSRVFDREKRYGLSLLKCMSLVVTKKYSPGRTIL